MVKGDETAYRVFYDAYFGRLSRYLLVVTGGDEEASREALQGTLIRVVRYVKVFSKEEIFWSWLTVLARSAHADHRRKRGRYRAFMDRFSTQSHIEHVAPDAANDEGRLDDALQRRLLDLPAEEQDLIRLKYADEMSVAGIAQRIDMTEKAVESWLVRVRRKLKQAVLKDLKDEPNS
jgi:RNA polymerase sigma-70 factor (ECF subfamily)